MSRSVRVPRLVAGALAVLATLAGCSTSERTPHSDSSLSPVVAPAANGGTAGSASTASAAGGGADEAGAGAHAAAAGTGATAPASALPCAVAKLVAKHCASCHADPPRFAAPLSLVSHEDFTRSYAVQTTVSASAPRGAMLPVHELVKLRVNQSSAQMPPSGHLPDADLAVLNAWLDAGAPAGDTSDAACDLSGGPANGNLCHGKDPYAPLVPRPGETCYELQTHGGQSVGDASKFMVTPGEHDEQFYFRVPWPTGAQVTRYGTRFDNIRVLHHWALFTTAKPASMEGKHEATIGTVIGDSAQLLAGWAVGDCPVEFPEDLAFELPPANTMLNVQWHYFNTTGEAQPDNSIVQVCTVPAGTRKHSGSFTWLGTEFFNGPLGMPPGQASEFSGTCINDSGAPVTIWGFWPHMHKLGRRMRSVVHRVNGSSETVFDRAFDFAYQTHYENTPLLVLAPGDSITSTCTFDNVTDKAVAFGPSTTDEMCYQFAFAYPARALDNGVISLVGATNTCW